MSCQDIAAALVDERLPRPPDFQAHLERCAACRSLARLHTSASALQLPEPPAPAALAREAILGEVRRRQHRRRRVATVTATAAVVTLFLLVSPHEDAPVPVEDAPVVVGGPVEGTLRVEQPERTAPAGQGDEVVSIGELFGEVYGYTRTLPGVQDEMYRPFGALAVWVRLPDDFRSE
ncbi:hypothetical protein F0U60_32090 [Archangium minus]|uniref:Zinc-finger domain-containing protein n=1 Tax=Archangium minus TaxID=83450 RepID=A0ABY9WYN1_9BACT|nr:hypothetical protein F0U60_32090 [Archangium minus]